MNRIRLELAAQLLQIDPVAGGKRAHYEAAVRFDHHGLDDLAAGNVFGLGQILSRVGGVVGEQAVVNVDFVEKGLNIHGETSCQKSQSVDSQADLGNFNENMKFSRSEEHTSEL